VEQGPRWPAGPAQWAWTTRWPGPPGAGTALTGRNTARLTSAPGLVVAATTLLVARHHAERPRWCPSKHRCEGDARDRLRCSGRPTAGSEGTSDRCRGGQPGHGLPGDHRRHCALRPRGRHIGSCPAHPQQKHPYGRLDRPADRRGLGWQDFQENRTATWLVRGGRGHVAPGVQDRNGGDLGTAGPPVPGPRHRYPDGQQLAGHLRPTDDPYGAPQVDVTAAVVPDAPVAGVPAGGMRRRHRHGNGLIGGLRAGRGTRVGVLLTRFAPRHPVSPVPHGGRRRPRDS